MRTPRLRRPRRRLLLPIAIAFAFSSFTVFVGPPAARATVPSAKTVDGSIADWTGTSPLIAGMSVTSAGEFIYQDYLYDDTGADVLPRSSQSARGYAVPNGTYQYPVEQQPLLAPRWGGNAADLFQFRAAHVGGKIHFLFHFNSLFADDTTVAAVAIGGTGTTPMAWPLNAGISTPGTEHVLTVWGTGGQWDSSPLASVGGSVAVGLVDNAIEVSIPDTLLADDSFRAFVGTGLWDGTQWTDIGPVATYLTPGGGDFAHPNLFNVAFRDDEPTYSNGPAWNQGNFWFEMGQAAALAAGSIADYHADIDLSAADTGSVSVTGWHQRLYESSVTVPPGEGVYGSPILTEGRGCTFTSAPSCSNYRYLGKWQPYSIYIPATYDRMVVLLHGGGYPLNWTSRPGVRAKLGDELGALLVEPFQRGPTGWTTDYAHLDVLEAMDDASAHYAAVDETKTTLAGISMGGYGAYKMLGTNPDLFGAGIMWSASPGDPGHDFFGWEDPAGTGNGDPQDLLENNRSHDLMINHGMTDQWENYAHTLTEVPRLDNLQYRYRFLSHYLWQHTTVLDVDHWDREVAFLDPQTVEANPPHVTFTMSEAWWRPDISPRLVFDKAYWVSGFRTRNQTGGYLANGTVDVVTHGNGGTELATTKTGPLFSQGPPTPYFTLQRTKTTGPTITTANAFEASLTNVRNVSFDLARMGLSTATTLTATITTNGVADVRLLGAGTVTSVVGAPYTQVGADVVLTLPGSGSPTADAVQPVTYTVTIT